MLEIGPRFAESGLCSDKSLVSYDNVTAVIPRESMLGKLCRLPDRLKLTTSMSADHELPLGSAITQGHACTRG